MEHGRNRNNDRRSNGKGRDFKKNAPRRESERERFTEELDETVVIGRNAVKVPPPKVTSAVIHCPARKEPPVKVKSEASLWRAVKAGFAQRRKTLVNSLQSGYPLPKDVLAEAIAACGLPADVRGEKLSLADYARLADALDEKLAAQ